MVYNSVDVACFAVYVIILQMEHTGKGTEQADSTACIDLENILQKLDALSNCMDHLACMYHC